MFINQYHTKLKRWKHQIWRKTARKKLCLCPRKYSFCFPFGEIKIDLIQKKSNILYYMVNKNKQMRE